jgi:opacity protein-like surface antigen
MSIIRSLVPWLTCAVVGALSSQALAEGTSNQVFFRGGYSGLTEDRGGEVFTDTLGTLGKNDGKGGAAIGAGLDLTLVKSSELKGVALLGEIFVDYSQLSNKTVLSTTDFLLNKTGVTTTLPAHKVRVTSLNVTVAPKLRLDTLGIVRPWIIPVGLAFLVNSPPSNQTTYLDVGLHFGAGCEVKVIEQLSVGVDFRYTHGFELAKTQDRYYSVGGYAGVNF